MMLFWKKPTPIAQGIIESLANKPDKWQADDNSLWIGASRMYDAPIRVWISSGPEYIRLKQPWEVRFCRGDRRRIWKAFKKWGEVPVSSERFLELLKAAEAA